jgi:hypothetical protein
MRRITFGAFEERRFRHAAVLTNWPDGVPAKNVRCKKCEVKVNPEAYGGAITHAKARSVRCEVLG